MKITTKNNYSYDNNVNLWSIFKWVGLLFLFIFIIIIAFGSFFKVNPGESAVVTVLWKIQDGIYQDGLHFKIPLISKVIKYDVKNTKLELSISASSRDLQDVSTIVAVNYNINKTKVKNIYKEIGDKNQLNTNVIEPLIHETVKSVYELHNAEDLVKKRNEVSNSIRKELSDKLTTYSVDLLDINIINFKFSDSFNDAIENKVKAEQEALTEKNKLEKIKYEAQQKIEEAKGEAEKIRINSEAIQKQGGKEYLQLQFINKWNGELPKVVGNQNCLMLDANTLFNNK